MDYKEHLFLGTALGVILISLTHYFFNWFEFNLINIGFMFVIIYVYSLLSDVDTKAGTIVWTFIPLGLITIIYGYVYNNQIAFYGGVGLIAVTFLAAQFFPHRGFTHSILFGLCVSLPWIYLSWNYSILAFLCFYSHLAADSEFLKWI